MAQFRLIDNFKQAIGAIEKGHRKALQAAVMEWHRGIVRDQLTGNRTGHRYRVPGAQKKKYTASAPGEPPASRLGSLRSSYRWIVKRNEAAVGTRLDYGLYLEKGTKRMAPRPHVQPAFRGRRTAIYSKLRKRWI